MNSMIVMRGSFMSGLIFSKMQEMQKRLQEKYL